MNKLAEGFVGGTTYSRIPEAIGEAIFSGELKQGQRLKVRDLSKRFGVGTNPIREALNGILARRAALVASDADVAGLREVERQLRAARA